MSKNTHYKNNTVTFHIKIGFMFLRTTYKIIKQNPIKFFAIFFNKVYFVCITFILMVYFKKRIGNGKHVKKEKIFINYTK